MKRPDGKDYKGDGAGQDYTEDLNKYIDYLESLLPKEDMEKCISCGETTDIPTTTDVNNRATYVEGAGQMCRKCWDIIYGY